MQTQYLLRKGLAVGIFLLFIGIAIIPTSAQKIDKVSLPILRGTTLYVGGSGPKNYSSIQAAVNYTSDGDTVFVYATSSPYYEHVIVNKSINLIGEDRNTTSIDGKEIDDTIWIKASFVTVSGFTISNSSNEDTQAGVSVIEKKWYHPDDPPWLTNILISNCVIKNNYLGIVLYGTHASTVSSCIIHNNQAHSIFIVSSTYDTINDCDISHNGGTYPGGIVIGRDTNIGSSNNITISNCSLSNNTWYGVSVFDHERNIEVCHNTVSGNTHDGMLISQSSAKIYDNNICCNGVDGYFDGGILLEDCYHNITVNHNNIETNNQYGLYLLRSSANSVNKNNFIQNKCNAVMIQFSLCNHWKGNYWTDWVGVGPKLIKGKLGPVSIPWFNFDWHPAQKPYDIMYLR